MASVRTATNASTTTASLALTTPAGAAAGDVLVVYLHGDAADVTFTAPSADWTQQFDVAEAVGSQPMGFACFTCPLTGAPAASYTFTGSAAAIGGTMHCIAADGGTSPALASSGTPAAGAAAGYTTAGVTNVADSRVLVACFANDTDFTVSTPPAGMTAHGRVTVSGQTAAHATYTEVDPTGTPLTRSITWSGSDDNYGHLLLVSFSTGGGGGSTQPPRTMHQHRLRRAA